MKTHTADGRWFLLSAECEADTAFLDAIDMGGYRLHVVQMVRPGRHNAGVVLSADRNDARALKAQAAGQLSRAFGELIRLGLREAALDRHVGAPHSDPEPKKERAARLVELQRMLETGGDTVVKDEVERKEVVGAHGTTLVAGHTPISGGLA